MSKPKEFEEKLKGEQGKLIQTRFELMEQTNEGLNKIREMVGQSIIKDNPENFNLSKYQLKKSMIDPKRLKEALVKSVDEKYLKPALKAHGLTSGHK